MPIFSSSTAVPSSTSMAVLLALSACSSAPPPPPQTVQPAPAGKTVFVVVAAPEKAPPPPSGPPGDVAGAEQERKTTERRGRVLKEVEAFYPKISKCYEDGRAKTPDLAGRVVIRFTVAPSGDVVQADDAGSTLPAPAVVACVLGVFSGMKLTPWDGKAVTAVLPIDLSVRVDTLLFIAARTLGRFRATRGRAR